MRSELESFEVREGYLNRAESPLATIK